MVAPATLASFVPDVGPLQTLQGLFSPGSMLYLFLYTAMVIFFTFFYTAVVFNPADVAENMKKQGGYIPGIRPGRQTAEFIDKVLTRITSGGAIYLAAVCLLPEVLLYRYNVPFYFGGTSLLIVVGVALDTVNQIESHLLTQHYDGMIRTGSNRRRRNR
jgi:preprotein translocase subunit SecY